MWIEVVPSAEVAKDNCLGKESSCEPSVAIALQMNILSQEDITTATTAAKTAKYKWPAALFRVYGNNIQKKKKPEALAVVFLISLSIHKNIGRA